MSARVLRIDRIVMVVVMVASSIYSNAYAVSVAGDEYVF